MLEFLRTYWGQIVGTVAALAAWAAYVRTKAENRKWKTLEICAQFELNSSVAAANRKILEAFANGVPEKGKCKELANDAEVVLNYLDGIAIGIRQGLYIERLAKDHLKEIVHMRVRDLLESNLLQDAAFDKIYWRFLVEMAERWSRDQPYYRPWYSRLLRP